MRKSKWKHPNAQKHAVFSRFLILDGEDPREFQKLVDELAEEWQPDGKSEHDAVLDIAKGIWLKRRVELFLMVEGIRNAGNPNHPSHDERVGLRAFIAYAKLNPRNAFGHGSHHLRKDLLETLQCEFPYKDFKSTAEWLAAIKNGIDSMLSVFDHAYSDAATYLALMNPAATFSGDLFDQTQTRYERLNAMIDRATKRLVQAKAMKQMLGHVPEEPKGEVIKLRERKSSTG